VMRKMGARTLVDLVRMYDRLQAGPAERRPTYSGSGSVQQPVVVAALADGDLQRAGQAEQAITAGIGHHHHAQLRRAAGHQPVVLQGEAPSRPASVAVTRSIAT
jgi:hypothetical protein